MTDMNTDVLLVIMPAAKSRAITYAPLLTACMHEFGIDTPRRQAAFLSQIAHESGSLLYTREIDSGERYEGRKDLGNTQVGDGPLFVGRGLIQLTGRTNYANCSGWLGLNLLQYPELLEKPEAATRSAGWFWQSRKLNQAADLDKFGILTKAINGGYNGIDERISFWLRARQILGVTPL